MRTGATLILIVGMWVTWTVFLLKSLRHHAYTNTHNQQFAGVTLHTILNLIFDYKSSPYRKFIIVIVPARHEDRLKAIFYFNRTVAISFA